jgi:hypothetical protein
LYVTFRSKFQSTKKPSTVSCIEGARCAKILIVSCGRVL